jgi:monothiol glutaredoxin
MSRTILDEAQIHPSIREKIDRNHRDIVEEVQAAVAQHDVVVVGMKQNPHPKKARKALTAHGTRFHYLEYGSYLNTWRRRTALKMWTGWPTFPMVFVKGVLVGGAADLQKLIDSGELDKMLSGEAATGKRNGDAALRS